MAYDIGPRIGIDGEAEARKQLKALGAQFKALDSEMKVLESTYADGDKSVQDYANENEVLQKQINVLIKRMEEQVSMLNKAQDKYDENTQQVQGWQRAVNETAAQINTL